MISSVVLAEFILGAGLFYGHSKVCANSYATAVNPLTIEQAKKAVEGYLKNLNNSDLELKECMIFNNNAYLRIVEKSAGIGTLALLFDTSTLSVNPEYVANMVWNQIYGLIGENGKMGGVGMTSGHFRNSSSVASKMTGTPEQTNQIAREYLDLRYSGYNTVTDADPLYGFYTIDIINNSQPVGMLSVNSLNGQVFLYIWHGTYIEMWE